MLTALLSTTLLLQPATTPPQFAPLRTMQGLRSLTVAPAPTGSRFAASLENRSVRIIEAATGQTLRTFTGHPDSIYGVAWNPAGTILATGDDTARIWLWDVKSGKKIREFTRDRAHQRGIQSLSFSPDGRTLASTGKDDMIVIWNVSTGKPVQRILGKGANFYSAMYSPAGGTLLAPTLNDGLRFYRVADWSVIRKIDNHGGQGALDIATNAVGTLAVTAGRNAAATLIDLRKRERVNSFKGHEDWVIRAALTPNGRFLATSSSDRTVRLWNTSTFQSVKKIEDQSAVGAPITFTRDGRFLVTADVSDFIQIFSVTPAQGPATGSKPTRRRR